MSLNVMESLGQAVAFARKERHKTLRSTAVEIGVSASLLSLVEQNKHVPSREVIEALARVLGGDPDKWCGLAGRITPAAEASLAKLAMEKPEFFRFLRGMVEQSGGTYVEHAPDQSVEAS